MIRPCKFKHPIHLHCNDGWRTSRVGSQNPTCPTCRMPI
jgi:hypothetical protein